MPSLGYERTPAPRSPATPTRRWIVTSPCCSTVGSRRILGQASSARLRLCRWRCSMRPSPSASGGCGDVCAQNPSPRTDPQSGLSPPPGRAAPSALSDEPAHKLAPDRTGEEVQKAERRTRKRDSQRGRGAQRAKASPNQAGRQELGHINRKMALLQRSGKRRISALPLPLPALRRPCQRPSALTLLELPAVMRSLQFEASAGFRKMPQVSESRPLSEAAGRWCELS
jgi:hypothetical protein